jgi:transcriptional regulator with XRE-family HTH domain
VMRALREEQRRLGKALRNLREDRGFTQEGAAESIGLHAKHLQRLESGLANVTLATLVAIAHAYRIPLRSLFDDSARTSALPFVRVPAARLRPFRNALPLYSLKAAAGRFAAAQEVEPQAWVAPSGRTRPAPGLFVAQVVGSSMKRRIPDGAYCVFRHPVQGDPQGRVVLAQHRQIHDPDHGGRYTVKVYDARKSGRGADPGRVVEVRLKPDTDVAGYRPIVVRESHPSELAIVAELVEVLRHP